MVKFIKLTGVIIFILQFLIKLTVLPIESWNNKT